MAALTESIEVSEKTGHKLDLPMAVDIIFRGAILKNNAAGFLAPAAAEAGATFAGIAYEEVDNSGGSAGDLSAKVIRQGIFLLTGAGLAQLDVGELVFASDDQTISTTQGSNEQQVGKIVEFVSATQVWVAIDASADA